MHAAGDLHIGIGSRLWAPTSMVIGEHVYVGKWCTIEVDGSIGKGCLIANNVGLIGRDDHDMHEVGKLISQAAWIGVESRLRRGEIHVEEDVWIGYGAIVLSGVRIGRGAVIAAGSVVTKDVAPYAVVAGVPANTVGQRFTAEEIQQHESQLYG